GFFLVVFLLACTDKSMIVEGVSTINSKTLFSVESFFIELILSFSLECYKLVKSLYAFGSVCTEKFNDNSDIDLLISFYPMDYGDYADSYFELAEKLEDVFQRPVDLVTDKSLGNPYFIESINQTKTPIYEA
ncbi:MAG TPA: nucleotidyltransferase domain-containing protein, partial [Tenuifilaceae bacterium]|nr:nucleotidyltransferase domain-containing protein [Tenuifilaceae bacterium]